MCWERAISVYFGSEGGGCTINTMHGSTRRISSLTLLIGVLGVLYVSWTLSSSFTGEQKADPQLQILRHDPMASWDPSVVTGTEQRTERASSDGLITGTNAKLLRVIPLSTEVGVLDEASRAAASAGWVLQDRAQADTIIGSRNIEAHVVTISLSLLRPPDSGINGPTLLISLTGT